MNSLTLKELNELDESEYIAALESLYEYSPWVVRSSARARPFTSIKALQASKGKPLGQLLLTEILQFLVFHEQ